MRTLVSCLALLWVSGSLFAGDESSGQRLVSLSPGLTETLYALDLGERLIGRSDYCDYPPAALALPTAGTAMAPNFELIATLGPTAIVTEANIGSSSFELEKLATMVRLPWLSLSDTVAGVRTLGARFDRREAADHLAARMLSILDVEVPQSAPRVLLALSGEVDGSPIWFIRRNSLHGSALHAAGARNAVEQDVSGNASLSIEGLLGLDPDVIVVMLADGSSVAEARVRVQEQFSRLPDLRAVQNQRVGVTTDPGYLRTGPRILDFAEALKAELDWLLAREAHAAAGQ
jgi:iron complex transport system substrate-binding protein